MGHEKGLELVKTNVWRSLAVKETRETEQWLERVVKRNFRMNLLM